jgi:hypothetical protein
MDRLEGAVLAEGAASTAESTVDDAQPRTPARARTVLMAMSAAHALALILSSFDIRSGGFWLLLGLNVLAIAGLSTRTRAGWVAALLFVLAASVRWAGAGIDETQGFLALLAAAAAVFFVTDPSLRREHGIAG